MRKVITCIFALVAFFGAFSAMRPAIADNCRGDLYCDGVEPPERPDCRQNGLIICSAGDVRIREIP